MGSGAATGRVRRTKAEIGEVERIILEVLKVEKPATIRQVYYQLVSRGAVDKTEQAYAGVGHILSKMRQEGRCPFSWIADNTRWMRKPPTHSSLESALERTAEAYRRSVWDDQGVYCEIWLEKDALAGVLSKATSPWDVPLMVTRGYASISYLYEAAVAMRAQEKPVHVYYFGDRDPSGVDINRSTEANLRKFGGPKLDLTFTRVAVTERQVDEMKLPTRPTKKSDSRSRNFKGESVEVDAISPTELRRIATDCITRHIDQAKYAALQDVERMERLTLKQMAWEIDAFRESAEEFRRRSEEMEQEDYARDLEAEEDDQEDDE